MRCWRDPTLHTNAFCYRGTPQTARASHERAPLSRRVMMAAACRSVIRQETVRPVEARSHDVSVCHVTRHQVRVREWSLAAERLSAFVANDHRTQRAPSLPPALCYSRSTDFRPPASPRY